MIVGMVAWPRTVEEVEASLDELALLVDTAGADEAARVVQRREAADPATYIGRGKAEELRRISEAVDADTVVFDDELTPAQQRNLERILGRTAIDRTAVILDIFAQNAHTQEGRAQVELALSRYRLPRLRGMGLVLSQQAGGIGTRGPGETQLEVDRRRIMRRIRKLEVELRDLEVDAPDPATRRESAGRCGRCRSSATPTPASPPCSMSSPTPACSSRTSSFPPSTPGHGVSTCPEASRCCALTPSGSCASCPISLSTLFMRPWRSSGPPTCSCTSSTSPRPTRRRRSTRFAPF